MEKLSKIVKSIIFILSCSIFCHGILAQNSNTNNLLPNQDFSYKIYVKNIQGLDSGVVLLGNKNDFSKHEGIPNLFSKQVFLCYLNINPNRQNNRVFTLKCPNTIGLKIYYTRDIDSASLVQIKENSYTGRNGYYIFEFPQNTRQALLRIETTHYKSFKIESESSLTVFQDERDNNIYYSITVGILLLLLLYHAILFFIVGEKFYLYFIFQILISTVYIILEWGIYFIHLHHLLHQFVLISFYLSLILFFLAFIRISIHNKKVYISYTFVLFLTLVLGIASLLVNSIVSKHIIEIFGLILIGTFVFTSIRFIKNSLILFVYYIVSWIILFIGMLLMNLYLLTGSQYHWDLNHSFELGLVISNIVLGFAFGNKINIYKDEKEFAEISEIEALYENEKLIHEQNIILENLIVERNKELLDKIKISEKQKQEIELQNETINHRIIEIEKINEELIQKNIEISCQNKELEKSHKFLEQTVKKRTKKLIKAKEKAIVADKLKTSFLNNLTQEINIPMNAITGYSSIITDKDLSKETRNEYLNKIIYYVDVLLESVDNIVILSRLQAGAVKPRFVKTNLIGLIDKMKGVYYETFNSKGSKLDFELNGTEIKNDVYVYADIDKMKQISSIVANTLMKIVLEGRIQVQINIQDSSKLKSDKKERLSMDILLFCPPQSQKEILTLFDRFVMHYENNVKFDNHIELCLSIVKGYLKVLKAKSKIQSIDDSLSSIKLIFPIPKNEKL